MFQILIAAYWFVKQFTVVVNELTLSSKEYMDKAKKPYITAKQSHACINTLPEKSSPRMH